MLTTRQLQRKMRQRLSQIARAVLAPCDARVSSLQLARVDAFFRDSTIRIAAAHEKFPSLDADQTETLVNASYPFQPADEPVIWHPQPKGPRMGHRFICDFGPILTLRHRLIAAAADAQLRNGTVFYDQKRTGVPAAVTAILAALESVGPWLLSADIKDCFQSINIDAIYNLNILPSEVIRYALDYRHLTFIKKEEQDHQSHHSSNSLSCSLYRGQTCNGAGPRGLLQGCSASNAILRHLLSDIVQQVRETASIFVYVDNIFVVAPTPEHCRAALKSLSCHLANCPAGPLLFGKSEIVHIEDGVDILGYHLIRNYQGSVCVQLSEKNLGKISDYLKCGYPDVNGQPQRLSADELYQKIVTAYPLLDPAFKRQIIENIHSSS